MPRFLFVPVLVILFAMPIRVGARESLFLVEVKLSGPEDLPYFYQRRLSIIARKGDVLTLEVSAQTLETLAKDGIHFLNLTRSTPMPPLGAYHTSGEMAALLEQAADDYPDILSIRSIGRSVSGRDILLVKLSDNAERNEAEPGILFDASAHGNENIGTEVCLDFLFFCLENYEDDPEVRDFVDRHEIYFVPMVNPDGVDAGRRRNNNFVDLNRDHPFFWEPGWTSRPTYASQPETRAMVDLALNKNFVLAISYHSGAVVYNYLWDSLPSDGHPPPDAPELIDLAAGYGERAQMGIVEGYDWYQIHGSSEESYYGSNGTLAGIVELSYGQPPPAFQIDLIAETNREAMFWFARRAGRGVHGLVTDAVTGEAVGAMILSDRDTWPVYAKTPHGDYWRVLVPGSVEIWAYAPGYQNPAPVEAEVGEDADGVEGNFALTPAFEYRGAAMKVPAVHMADPEDRHANNSLPHMALRRADGVPFHLGVGGFIVLDLGYRAPIIDEAGEDFRVVVAGPDEGYQVQAGEHWTGPWVSLGEGLGSASFDLAGSGLAEARYIRINDDGDGDPNAADAGLDLDALHYNRSCDAPEPDFSAEPLTGEAPLEVRFLPSYGGVPGCTESVRWDFGDGESSTRGRVSHIYIEEGVYTVTLRADGPAGTQTMSKTAYIAVLPGQGNDDDIDDDDFDDDLDDDFEDDDERTTIYSSPPGSPNSGKDSSAGSGRDDNDFGVCGC